MAGVDIDLKEFLTKGQAAASFTLHVLLLLGTDAVELGSSCDPNYVQYTTSGIEEAVVMSYKWKRAVE